MAHILEQHLGYLQDSVRIDALRNAVAAVVRPGDIAVDLGSGTGVLAFMACEAGAARVYAIEQGPIIGLARELARVNGFSDRIQFIRECVAEATLPERADVAVSDLLGEFAFEGGVFEVLLDAGTRLLKPGGRTIPRAVTLYAAPIESPRLREHLQFVAERPAGFDMTPLLRRARNTSYRCSPSADALLAPAMAIARCPLPPSALPVIEFHGSAAATRSGTMDALAGWFDAELAPGVHMTNAPTARTRVDRYCAALPVSPPIEVEAGDAVAIRMRLLVADRVVSWSVRRTTIDGRVQSVDGSTFAGLVISREDLPDRFSPRDRDLQRI